MEENERREDVGEVVTPQERGEGTTAEAVQTAQGGQEAGDADRPRGGEQSHEENRRYQAARLGGERTGYERAMREVGRQLERSGLRHPLSGEPVRTLEELSALGGADRQEELRQFVARDVEQFLEAFPGVDPAALDGDGDFRRFCGSRYGREPLAKLYADYREITGRAQLTGRARSESRAARATGAGGGGTGDGLSAGERAELEAWNRAFPRMKMTAREFKNR